MAKKLGKGKARNPSKKEKLQRALEQIESDKLAQKYIYPLGIGALVFFFIVLYGVLYYKSLN